MSRQKSEELEIITSRDDVFIKIGQVIRKEFPTGEVIRDEEENVLFILLDGISVALIDYDYYEGDPLLYLSFYVACVANTAIQVYTLIDKAIDIAVISSNVYYSAPHSKKGYQRILYNKNALEEYATALSNDIYSQRKAMEDTDYFPPQNKLHLH